MPYISAPCKARAFTVEREERRRGGCAMKKALLGVVQEVGMQDLKSARVHSPLPPHFSTPAVSRSCSPTPGCDGAGER